MAKLGLETTIVDSQIYENSVQLCRENGVVLPTFAQLARPSSIPQAVLERLGSIGPDEAHPLNLFRVHWFNGLDRVNQVRVPEHIVLPKALTGVDAPIVVGLGRTFPMIEAHKVLAAYGCLAPRLVTGQYDPKVHRAIWPSTGNYCRGGVAISRVMGCRGVAVLPEGMSQERFDWLDEWATEPSDIIRTPGSESNVKEIYDKCAELDADPANIIFNQFCEFGNHLVHYEVTGRALETIFAHLAESQPRLKAAAFVSATGSAGTIAAGDYLKDQLGARIVAVEALECPTMLENGFGEHNIQGIGDKHIPYIHNVMNTDFVVGVSDRATDELGVLFNTDVGRRYLADRRGIPDHVIAGLDSLGLSGICNVLAAIKTARYLGLGPDEAVFTLGTDSAAMYGSERAATIARRFGGTFDDIFAAETYGAHVLGAGVDHVQELDLVARRRIFNLGYFTWVEQQGVSLSEFSARREQSFWRGLRDHLAAWDEMIVEFNQKTARSS